MLLCKDDTYMCSIPTDLPDSLSITQSCLTHTVYTVWCHSLCSISVRVAEKIEKRYLGKAVQSFASFFSWHHMVYCYMCKAAGATHPFKKVFHADNNSVLSFLDYQLCTFSVTSYNHRSLPPHRPIWSCTHIARIPTLCSHDNRAIIILPAHLMPCSYVYVHYMHGFCMSKATNTSYTCTCMWVSVDVVCMWERGSEWGRESGFWNQTLPVYINSRFLCSSGLPMEYLPTYITNLTDREGACETW